jgi:chromosomal replication initiation ATPase DnaA
MNQRLLQGWVAPRALLTALDDQRSAHPEDGDALDRLFELLEISHPTLAEIKAAICEFYAINPLELTSKHREVETTMARQLFCYFAYRHTRFSLALVGMQVGLEHHSTVIHAIRKIEKHAQTMSLVRDDIDLLRLRISEKILRRLHHRGTS